MTDLIRLKTMLTISTVVLAVVAVILIVITILWLREHWKRKEADERTRKAIEQAGQMAFCAAEWRRAARDKKYRDALEEKCKAPGRNSPIAIFNEHQSGGGEEDVK